MAEPGSICSANEYFTQPDLGQQFFSRYHQPPGLSQLVEEPFGSQPVLSSTGSVLSGSHKVRESHLIS